MCFCSFRLGWCSRDQTKRSRDDGRAEDDDEDPGHQICGNEEGVRDEGMANPSYVSVYLRFHPLTVEIKSISVFIFQKIERMKSELHFLDVNEEKKNKHVFFVDSKKEGNISPLLVEAEIEQGSTCYMIVYEI